MQTQLTAEIQATTAGQEADRILRSCVHCGFCTATCPTYQLLGDELDGPRGRIYLIKQILEGQPVTAKTQLHLDRCLTCRSCETTCPSGVQYHQLLDTGRKIVSASLPRSAYQRLLRWGMRKILPYPGRIKPMLNAARLLKPVLPKHLAKKIPGKNILAATPVNNHQRKIILFQGCVQSVVAANINQAAINVLDKLGIQAILAPNEKCCGAVNHHLDDQPTAMEFARNNIDRWLPLLDDGAEALVVTASACGLEIIEYPHLLAEDSVYQQKALQLAAQCMDIGKFLSSEINKQLKANIKAPKIAFHSPCTLQHGLGLTDTVPSMLRDIGFEVTEPQDAHLCCGSAGTYSITQPKLSGQLRTNKLTFLEADSPELIATANIGCLLHLQETAVTPVKHWIELVHEHTSTI